MKQILVVDDEPKSVGLLRDRLQEDGHEVVDANSIHGASRELAGALYDLLILDVRLPDGSGLDLIAEAKKLQPNLQIIVITAFGSVKDAVKAIKLGANEYVLKPFEIETLALLVERTLRDASIKEEHSYLLNRLLEGESEVELVGKSAEMKAVKDLVDKVSRTRSNVLILGPSGTGKELVAQAVHMSSAARAQPLVKVNCPGIPEQLFESELFGHMKGAFTGAHESRKGKFELAGRGTLFLDEIGEIPQGLQAKLLRAIEERRITPIGGGREISVEARIIAATNRDLEEMVEKGKFRQDLYYRLNVFPIDLPTLKNRRSDIADLAQHLLYHVADDCGLSLQDPPITDDALVCLKAYDWPGNVRELRNVLERALVLSGGGTVGIENLAVELQCAPQSLNCSSCSSCDNGDESEGFNTKVEGFKKKLLIETLKNCGWTKKDAATHLGLSQRALSHYVARYELDKYKTN